MFIEPMLLATAPAPFSDSHYIFEPKIDGHRLLFSQQSGRIRFIHVMRRNVPNNTPNYWFRLMMTFS